MRLAVPCQTGTSLCPFQRSSQQARCMIRQQPDDPGRCCPVGGSWRLDHDEQFLFRAKSCFARKKKGVSGHAGNSRPQGTAAPSEPKDWGRDVSRRILLGGRACVCVIDGAGDGSRGAWGRHAGSVRGGRGRHACPGPTGEGGDGRGQDAGRLLQGFG